MTRELDRVGFWGIPGIPVSLFLLCRFPLPLSPFPKERCKKIGTVGTPPLDLKQFPHGSTEIGGLGKIGNSLFKWTVFVYD
jgi:hypothetical protein